MTNKQTEEVIMEAIKIWEEQGRTEEQVFAVCNFMSGQGEIMLKTAIKEAEERGKETGIRQVGKWIKFPYRKGMKITKNIDGTGGLVNAGCEVCGGKLVSIRPQYPNGKKRNVCPTCATEIIESLDSNCNNRDAYTDKK